MTFLSPEHSAFSLCLAAYITSQSEGMVTLQVRVRAWLPNFQAMFLTHLLVKNSNNINVPILQIPHVSIM